LNFTGERPDSTGTLRESFNCAFAFASSANVAPLTAFAVAVLTLRHFYARKVPNCKGRWRRTWRRPPGNSIRCVGQRLCSKKRRVVKTLSGHTTSRGLAAKALAHFAAVGLSSTSVEADSDRPVPLPSCLTKMSNEHMQHRQCQTCFVHFPTNQELVHHIEEYRVSTLQPFNALLIEQSEERLLVAKLERCRLHLAQSCDINSDNDDDDDRDGEDDDHEPTAQPDQLQCPFHGCKRVEPFTTRGNLVRHFQTRTFFILP
jgi:hypothetical protein